MNKKVTEVSSETISNKIQPKLLQDAPLAEVSQAKPLKSAIQMEEMDLAHQKELTRGIFRNFERPGQKHKFSMRLFKDERQVKHYVMEDGKVYMVPRAVAQYINQNCWVPVHENILDNDGNQIDRLKTKEQRFAFDNGEYYEDVSPMIITPNKPVLGSF